MAKARSKKGRANQIWAWLEKEFPTRYLIEIRWVKELLSSGVDPETGQRRQNYAVCYRRGYRFLIELSERAIRNRTDVVESMLHEWVHIEVNNPDHPTKYWKQYGKLYRRFYEEGGLEESEEM